MAHPLDLWVHGLGQYEAFTSLCIPQHQTEIPDCANKGIPGSTAKRLTCITPYIRDIHIRKISCRLHKLWLT